MKGIVAPVEGSSARPRVRTIESHVPPVPGLLTPSSIDGLQRTAGNEAVAALLHRDWDMSVQRCGPAGACEACAEDDRKNAVQAPARGME